MAEGLESVIENAISESQTDLVPDADVAIPGDTTADTPDADTVVESDPTAVPDLDEDADSADADAETPAADAERPKEDAVVKEPSEVDKILEAAGIKAPKPGEKENKIPYSRTVKIIGNALKKATDSHTAVVNDLTTKLTSEQARAKSYENADRLASTDPDRYMEILATINPAFKKFLTGGAATAVAKTAAETAQLPEKAPGPDVKFEDGSVGYSPEQAAKREEWLIATAEERAFTRAKTMYEERFGPIEKFTKDAQTREAAAAAQAARLPGIRADIATQKEIWGDAFPADGTPEQKAVSKLIVEEKMSLAAALAKVLVPKTRQTRDQMRKDLLAEQRKRPAAAVRTGAAPTKAVADPNEVRDTESVIRDAIAAAGLEA